MSPLDHAFLIQTKPNSLETELAIENIFSMIEERVKPSSITLNKKRFTLKWPMTETVFLSNFPDARNLQKERNKRKRNTHACGKGREKRTISEILYRKPFHKGVEFADYFKKKLIMVYEENGKNVTHKCCFEYFEVPASTYYRAKKAIEANRAVGKRGKPTKLSLEQEKIFWIKFIKNIMQGNL